ncbi:binding-protein-dependent transport system inner membrane protein [Pandoraea eparura]|uniref:Binding-protein-dependent transport system inner membrane protein n=1 Tax=Pandoraea eparura TaxID=2508291 RepID=A0A5E4S6L1_9BURK|nr:ABC transporter permease [Pandoraea eparura]VVD70422.1 binding-protein-dependent transport system inner membrane protein [Pandoraea eparura]
MNGTTVRLVLNRLGVAVLTLLAVSLVIFTITNLLPGDAAQQLLGQDSTPELLAALRIKFGLDQPPYLRYLHWLFGLLTGSLGNAMANGLPVAELIGRRLPNSLMLAAATTAVSVPLALTIGILSAMYRGSLFDRIVNVATVWTVSVPEFLIATVAVLIFAVKLRWLSALSRTDDIATLGQFLKAYAMPVMTLCCAVSAQMARMTRAAVIDQLNLSYIEMARLKGVRPIRMVLTHALPNAIGPIVNAVALSLAYLIGGVIIVESIFNYPGIASLMVDSVAMRDIPVVQACAILCCAGYLVLLTLADVCAILANPRLRK